MSDTDGERGTSRPTGVVGVLFDVDGTLIDTNYLHAIAWWQAFRRAGLDVRMADIHRAVGMGADKLIPHLVGEQLGGQQPGGEHDDEQATTLSSDHDAIYSTWWPALRPLPGATELVQRCREAGLVTVLASSAKSQELAVIRRVLDVDAHLCEVTSSEDAQRSKPAPDLVQVALDKAGLASSGSVMVGDSVWDVRAAAGAGVRCIGVECGGTSAAELREAGAIEVYADPQDLLERWGESVLARVDDD